MSRENGPNKAPNAISSSLFSSLRFSIGGIFTILLIGALYFGKGFLLPVTLAFLLSLMMSPVVRAMRRSGIPEIGSAIFLVVVFATGVVLIAWSVSMPISSMIDDAPRIGFELKRKLTGIAKPIEAVKEAEESVKNATTDIEPNVQEVTIREPGLLSWAASGAPEILAGTALTLVLLLFLLASGELFLDKLVRSMPTLSDKKRWLRTAFDVEREVSRYLFTVASINVCVGVAIAIGLYFAGMADPILWGVAATLLNFIPYLGAVCGIASILLVSIVNFPSLGDAWLPPAIYITVTILEGQFITPALLGRRLQMNAVVVFLTIAFWGWLWGLMGALIAVPVLILVKTLAQHAEGFDGLAEFLSPRRSKEDDLSTANEPGTLS